jgi:hypothetical protein
MSNVTLVMSRTPTTEFKYGAKSGRWGTMAVVEGPAVLAGNFMGLTSEQGLLLAGVASTLITAGAVALNPFAAAAAKPQVASISLGGRTVLMLTAGGKITRVTEFDTMERFRADSGKGFYMQVKPRPQEPYLLTMMKSSTVAKLNKSGECLRVHGHGYVQQGTNTTAGILVHEAPNVSWLIGCIAPRLKGNRKQGSERSVSTQAMDFIFNAMGGFANGKRASLLVLDW